MMSKNLDDSGNNDENINFIFKEKTWLQTSQGIKQLENPWRMQKEIDFSQN